MRRWKSVVFASLWIASLAVACSLQDGGTIIGEGVDGSTADDGKIGADGSSDDGSTPGDANTTDTGGGADDAGSDTGAAIYLCGTSLVAHCTTDCAGFPFECPGSIPVCVNSCGMCTGAPFICDACLGNGTPAVARCEPQDAAAFSECLAGFSRCPCPSSDAGQCPGDNQTCTSGQCFECGEVDAGNVDDTEPCKTGTGSHQCKSDSSYVKCK